MWLVVITINIGQYSKKIVEQVQQLKYLGSVMDRKWVGFVCESSSRKPVIIRMQSLGGSCMFCGSAVCYKGVSTEGDGITRLGVGNWNGIFDDVISRKAYKVHECQHRELTTQVCSITAHIVCVCLYSNDIVDVPFHCYPKSLNASPLPYYNRLQFLRTSI